jgi:glyoxylase-like metal-dependent hydrolase (beta-lactamase superfamily II)
LLSFRATGQRCERFGFDGLLLPGQEVSLGDAAWEIHAAKGHDPHSIILFEPGSRTLLSADALWENGFGVVFPELVGEPSFDEVAATLDLIEALAPRVVVPGHGSVFHDAARALAKARTRLESFSKDPVRHARHALKVLIKFRLLEWQVVERSEWQQWMRSTPYLQTVATRFFNDAKPEELAEALLSELCAAGAAALEGSLIRNC